MPSTSATSVATKTGNTRNDLGRVGGAVNQVGLSEVINFKVARVGITHDHSGCVGLVFTRISLNKVLVPSRNRIEPKDRLVVNALTVVLYPVERRLA